jgi:flagellar biosynthesis/type III secretory pathway chaperone
MMNSMKSKLLVAGVFVSMLGISLPANAQSAEQWRAKILEEYNLASSETPVTDELNSLNNLGQWRAKILEEYNLASSETPVTDELNSLNNLGQWRDKIKEEYNVASSETPVTDEYGSSK